MGQLHSSARIWNIRDHLTKENVEMKRNAGRSSTEMGLHIQSFVMEFLEIGVKVMLTAPHNLRISAMIGGTLTGGQQDSNAHPQVAVIKTLLTKVKIIKLCAKALLEKSVAQI